MTVQVERGVNHLKAVTSGNVTDPFLFSQMLVSCENGIQRLQSSSLLFRMRSQLGCDPKSILGVAKSRTIQALVNSFLDCTDICIAK